MFTIDACSAYDILENFPLAPFLLMNGIEPHKEVAITNYWISNFSHGSKMTKENISQEQNFK